MWRTLAASSWLFAILACALLAGCAAPGEPTAPHPVVPVAVSDLSARQSGNSIFLTFTVPRQSTNRETLAELPALEVFRTPLAPGTAPDKKTMWRLAYMVPSERTDSYLKGGTIEFRDPLAAEDLSRGPGALLAYKVRTRVSARADSADSNIILERIFSAPAPPQVLQATVTETAIKLSWTPPEGAAPAGYRAYRAELANPEQGAAPVTSIPDASKMKSSLEMIGPATEPEFSDAHFEFDRTYLYTVRATAQYGADTVESEDSIPIVVSARDTFPPAPPTGLVTVLIPATSQGGASVELSWAISPEADVAGYYVYRSEAGDVTGDRITPDSLPSPAFRDTSVVTGKTYYYRVSAIDRAGNVSAPSAAVQIDIP